MAECAHLPKHEVFMGKKGSRHLYVFINGAFFLTFFLSLFVLYFFDNGIHFERTFWLFFVFSGVVQLLFLLTIRRVYYLFFGIIFCLFGLSNFIINSDIIPYSAYELWPINGIYFAIALIVTCFYKYKRLKMNYTVPAVIIFTISVIFMFFSFKIVPISFSHTVLVIFPLCWLFVIGWYFLQKLLNVSAKNDTAKNGDLK